jgi:hypothetical protein
MEPNDSAMVLAQLLAASERFNDVHPYRRCKWRLLTEFRQHKAPQTRISPVEDPAYVANRVRKWGAR